jgi:hypothetical protein
MNQFLIGGSKTPSRPKAEKVEKSDAHVPWVEK